MRGSLKNLLSKIGVDKAVFFTSFSNITGAFGSVISVILVIKYLSGVEQGFYYTFGSIVAIQVFFELGLNGIITQYVAHEVSHLKWGADNSLEGDQKYLSRLSSILHFSIKWYLIFSLVLIITLIIIGLIFFSRYNLSDESVSWVIPWILLATATSINLLVSPVVAFIQGLGKVKEIAKIQFFQQLFRLCLVWVGLVAGAKLYVLGSGSLIAAFTIIILVTLKYCRVLKGIWFIPITESVHYRTEIFPYQWKIALSWISGYLIFQLFNPVLFATEGAVVAGQMGITLAALNGILSFSFAWMTTKVPMFSGLIAQKEYDLLDQIFNKTLIQSSIINFASLFALGLVIFSIRYFNIKIDGKLLGNRFLAYWPMIFMMIPVLLNHIVGSWATYLRCHKREPFLINSITGGVLCLLSTLILGHYSGVQGVTSGYLIISILMFPWSYYIFKTKKSEWHG